MRKARHFRRTGDMSASTAGSKRLGIALVLAAALVALIPITNTAASPSPPASISILPKGGFYKGLTDQGRRGRTCPDVNNPDPFADLIPCQVTFRVKNRVVRRATFGIAFPACSIGAPLEPETDRVDRQGRFSVSEGDGVLRGRFVTRSKVKGTATVEPFDPSPGCSGIKTVSFTATRR